jgi:histidinol-phosphate aminotransferase
MEFKLVTAVHGSTDAGKPPQFDFSSNANAIGPNPIIREILRDVDPTHYPDPHYTALHQELADHHQVEPPQVAVGAGASELILRLARLASLPSKPESRSNAVLTFEHTFGEYQRSAHLVGLPTISAKNEAAFLDALRQAAIAFLCIPNNPTGTLYSPQFLQAVANTSAQTGTIVVADLAYLPLSQIAVTVPDVFWQLYAPNKTHGMTGIRAGYVVAPQPLETLRHLAPAWVLSVYGEAFLRSTLHPESQAWVAECLPTLWRLRDRLQQQLSAANFEQSWSQANFGLVNVGDAAIVTTRLRQQDIRVRDCTSFGLPAWIRASAQPEIAQDALLTALKFKINVKD